MAAGSYVPQPTSVVEGSFFKCLTRSRCSQEEGGAAASAMDASLQCDQHRWATDIGRPPLPQQDYLPVVDAAEADCTGAGEVAVASVQFLPLIRSGWWSEIGSRACMEDAHVCIDDVDEHFGARGGRPGAFYGVFDGHGGKDAANFVREHLLRFIVEDVAFPDSVDEAVRRAFLRADRALAQACLQDKGLSSGTTALTALIFGRTLLVANAGDCRAVLSKRGKAMDMSRDHKPCCSLERSRIEAVGGFVDDGYLNGQLAVARALGDWHMKGLKGDDGPLSAEPELQRVLLTEDDEFLIIGCDGLWDVFTSQNAVDFARKKLQQHNDPQRCSRELVDEAIRRDTCDNLTVVTVCFHKQAPPNLGVWTRKGVTKSISVEGLRNLQHLLDASSTQ